MTSTLQISTDPRGVARIDMARPAVFNAFDEAMIAELDAAVERLGSDPAVRVLVLAGQGKAFSAGADLNWMKRQSTASYDANLADARRFAAMLYRLASCPKPTVARVHGAALGGGFGLACACDIAIASTSASFAISEAKFGILPAVIGPYVVNAVGAREARALALTTRRIGAERALAIGLVHEVTSDAELDTRVAATVDELLAASPNAQREIKQFLGRLASGPVSPDVRELTAQTIARVRGTDEAREGFAAFLDKRAPAWVKAGA